MEFVKETKFRDKIKKMGGSYFLSLSPELREYLEIKDEGEVVVMLDEGKHGRFISFWKINED